LEEIENERRAKEEAEEAREAAKEEEVASAPIDEEKEKEKAAIRLGDTPKLEQEGDQEEEMKDEAGTPPPPTVTEKKEVKEPGTPKRPRSESADVKAGTTEGDTEMKDAKKQKI